MVTAGSADWSNYTLSTKATKLAGSEGFLVSFGVKDTGNYFWWNLGGWNNSKSVVEKAVNGGKTNVIEKNTVIQTGHEYDIRIEVTGRTAKLYLDGRPVGHGGRHAGRSRLLRGHQGRQVRRHHREGGQHEG